jgi:hypothetical protein
MPTHVRQAFLAWVEVALPSLAGQPLAGDEKTRRGSLCACQAGERAGMKTTDETVAAYIVRQAATVGRRAGRAGGARWVPCLPGIVGDCLGVLTSMNSASEGQAPSVAIHPNSRLLLTGSSDGGVRCWNLTSGALLWEGSERHASRIHAIAVSPDGQRLATASYDNTLRLWSTAGGRCLLHCQRHRHPSYQLNWSADSRRLASAGGDNALRVWDAGTGKSLLRCRGHQEMVWSVSWSPDNRFLASGSADHTIRLWDISNGNCVQKLYGHADWVVTVSWSPDGRWLASLGNDHTLRLWDTRTWAMAACWEVHRQAGFLKDLAWSPDSRLLASAARDRTISVWDIASGQALAGYTFPEDSAWRLAWSPDGAFLASSHSGDVFRLWDTRDLTAQAAVRLKPLPAELSSLPVALARLHRLPLYPPLSLLRELLYLTGGQPSALSALTTSPGIRGLIQLRWPLAARVGLVALLVRDLPLAAWQPPAGLSPGELDAALTIALSGELIEPQAPAPALTVLEQTAAAIDDRLLNLLALLGPDAVAADPGLPLRLLPRLPALPPLSVGQRRLLGLRLRPGGDGHAQGSGTGGERAGISLQGDLRTLLPSQLALPEPVLHSRDRRGELLYRARHGREPPRLRPLVLVLDVSPPCFGTIEATTRLAAHILAASLCQARVPAVLVAAGGAGQVRPLEQPADLLELWTLRSLEPANSAAALRLARTLCETLREGSLESRIVVFSHPWFGAEESLQPVPALRGLFVQYPGQQVRPVLAERCERWESVTAGTGVRLLEPLARLVGAP